MALDYESFKERVLSEVRRKLFLSFAKEDIERELGSWEEWGYWTPMLEAAVGYLIRAFGVDAWIQKHPEVTHCMPQILHAASYQTSGLKRYYSEMSLTLDGKSIYVFPEMAARLLSEVRNKILREESH